MPDDRETHLEDHINERRAAEIVARYRATKGHRGAATRRIVNLVDVEHGSAHWC